LDGFNVRFAPATGDKETRAKPVSAQAEAGNVKLVRGVWNDEFLRVLENFPASKHDDEVDGLTGAYECIATNTTGSIGPREAEEMRMANPHLLAPNQTRLSFNVRPWRSPRFEPRCAPDPGRFGRW
jgi:hypothetical protein